MAENAGVLSAVGYPGTPFSCVAEQLPAVFWSTDTRLRITASCGAALPRAELGADRAVGMELWEYFQTDRSRSTAMFAHRRALGGETVGYEMDWAGRTFQAQVAPLRDEQNRIVGCIGVAQEIGEHRRSQRRAEQLQAELAHMARIKTMGEMASGMAHELNQPLAVIVMQAEIAVRRMQLGKENGRGELLKTLEYIADQAYRAGEIIRRMKEFVRKVGPHRTSIDVSEIVDEVLALLNSELRHAGVSVNVELQQALPKVLADKIQIQQVLLNLIRNAIEAIECSQTGPRDLHVRADLCGDHLRISVRDTGRGIPAGPADEIFGTFYSTKSGGMGMGLAICRSIVETHGGHIRATRNSGPGATFTFTLPLTDENRNNGH